MSISQFLLSMCCNAPICSEKFELKDWERDVQGIYCVHCGRRIDEVTNEGIFYFDDPEKSAQWIDYFFQDLGTTITP